MVSFSAYHKGVAGLACASGLAQAAGGSLHEGGERSEEVLRRLRRHGGNQGDCGGQVLDVLKNGGAIEKRERLSAKGGGCVFKNICEDPRDGELDEVKRRNGAAMRLHELRVQGEGG